MKKILLLALIVIMAGCGLETVDRVAGIDIVHIDSCEYIKTISYGAFPHYVHKGNCKYCAYRDAIKWEKRKEELIKEIKEE